MSEAAFSTALRDLAAPVPPGLSDGHGRPAVRRLAVYRNNVAVSLSDALEASFPVVARLFGRDFFRAMAGEFLRAHPPQSPRLALWGDALPGFLETFPPVAGLGYLPEVARLEQALREAYHAADAAPIEPGALQLPPGRLIRSCLRFAPSVRLVRSPWPVGSIWRANAADGPPPRPGAEDVLVTRPNFDPEPQVLPPGGGAVVARLMGGARIEAATEAISDIDLAALFGVLLAGGAITALEEGPA